MVLFEYRRRAPEPTPDAMPRAESRVERPTRALVDVAVYASSFLFISLVTAEFIYAKDYRRSVTRHPAYIHERCDFHPS